MMFTRAFVSGSITTVLLCAPAFAQDGPPRARPLRPVNADGISWKASGNQGAVATGGAESASAGIEILKAGGNAADAAVATILALSVTDASLFCFGGEVPIIVYDAKRGVVEVVAGQGVAPRLATLDYFKKYESIPIQGLDVAAVPAVLDACLVTLERFGTLSFADVCAPTLKLLSRHQEPWHADLERTLNRLIDAERTSPDRFVGYRRVADLFYRGAIAREVDTWCAANGGLLRYSDLANHVTRVEEPIGIDYHGYRVLKCGPWTQGPALLQTLQLLDDSRFKGDDALAPDVIHAQVEALKLALADRDAFYADPLFHEIPLAQLLDANYVTKRRELIDLSHASLEYRPGNPLAGNALANESATSNDAGNTKPNDTTTCLVADKWGNVVAATPSGWSGVLVGDTGIWLGSRLQSFRKEAEHPNAVEPGKRPRITLTPTLVLKDKKPVAAISVAGGDVQDQVTLQLLLRMLDFGMSPEQAVTTPRYSTDHHIGSFAQTAPKLGSLTVTDTLDAATVDELAARGHKISKARVIGNPILLRIDPATNQIDAAGCPRSGRHALAY